MKANTDRNPTHHLYLFALALSLGIALLAWSAGHASGEGGPPKDVPNPTTTALDCSPAATEVGHSVHCTATVSGIVDATEGRVVFKSENDGRFSAGFCELIFGAKGKAASCGVDYTPNADGDSKHALHAAYVGDAINAPSESVVGVAILDGNKTVASHPQAPPANAKAHKKRRGVCNSRCRSLRHRAHSSHRG